MTIFGQQFAAIRLGVVALSLWVLSSCVVGPKYHPPAPQAPAPVYKESPTQFQDNGPWTVANWNGTATIS